MVTDGVDDRARYGLNRHVAFDPASDLEAFLKQVPARWVVYLLADELDRPVQLLCVKNLRYSLKGRLGESDLAGPSKRVNYRELVRNIYYCRVDSDFEADAVYYEAARQIFPNSYRGMTGFRPAWFVHVDVDATFPRYVKTVDLTTETGMLIGPVEDKHAAGRLIQLVEDCFDLCRYYSILLQSPNGNACAYKEMGKCPAPCDGSISLPQYRRLVEWSATALVDPAPYVREQQHRMRQAAAELRFESAAKIKQYIDELSKLGKGPFRHVASLKDFQFLCFQRGPGAGTAKVFLILPGRIEMLLCLLDDRFRPADVMRAALEGASAAERTLDQHETERVGVVAHHLFAAKSAAGMFLPLRLLDERSVMKAYREVQKQPSAEETDDEGITKELQSL